MQPSAMRGREQGCDLSTRAQSLTRSHHRLQAWLTSSRTHCCGHALFRISHHTQPWPFCSITDREASAHCEKLPCSHLGATSASKPIHYLSLVWQASSCSLLLTWVDVVVDASAVLVAQGKLRHEADQAPDSVTAHANWQCHVHLCQQAEAQTRQGMLDVPSGCPSGDSAVAALADRSHQPVAQTLHAALGARCPACPDTPGAPQALAADAAATHAQAAATAAASGARAALLMVTRRAQAHASAVATMASHYTATGRRWLLRPRLVAGCCRAGRAHAQACGCRSAASSCTGCTWPPSRCCPCLAGSEGYVAARCW